MSTTTTRARPPTAPKPPTTISPSTIISETASLTGTRPITLSAHSVIHPRAKLISTHAPVKIGEWCIISEKASVGLLLLPHKGEENSDGGEGVELFRGVVVETGAVVEARSVGEGTVVEAGARVGSGAVVGKHCKIGALCEVAAGEVLADFTVLYGMNQRRRDRPGLEGLKMRANERQVEVLRRLIPSQIAKFQSG